MNPTYDEVKRADHIGNIYSLVGCEVPHFTARVRYARQISENNESGYYADLLCAVYGSDYAGDSYLCLSYLREWVGKLVTALSREQVRKRMSDYPDHGPLGPVHRLFFMLTEYQEHQRNECRGGAEAMRESRWFLCASAGCEVHDLDEDELCNQRYPYGEFVLDGEPLQSGPHFAGSSAYDDAERVACALCDGQVTVHESAEDKHAAEDARQETWEQYCERTNPSS